MTREAELAWAAGLFEGEGSITTTRTPRIRVRFTMATTDRDVLERFRDVVGVGTISGPTRNSGSTKDLWRWHASRPVEVQMLARYFGPWLGERRAAALERCLTEFKGQPARKPHWNSVKTHCPRGHAYDEANTHRSPDGRRYCRTCMRARYAHLDVEDARVDLSLLELRV